MDFAFTEDQESIRELTRKILEERVTHDRLRQIEATPEWFDAETFRELASANLLGVALDEKHGGMGMGFLELCIVLCEVGRAVAPVPVLPTLLLGALPIARFGTAEQKERFLPRVARGDCILTAALLEPASADPRRINTLASRVSGGFRLVGRKTCVPAVHLAERVLVPAQLPGGRIGFFLVDPRAPGLRSERQHGTSHEPQFLLSLEDVAVTEDDLLGGVAAEPDALSFVLDRAVAGLCAVELGVAEKALAITAEYARKREQFGQAIGSFQAVHQRAGDAFIDVECIRWTTWRAVSRLADGAEASDDVAVAKFWAGEGGHRVTYAAQHLHGGIGVDVDYPIHRYYLWSRQVEVLLGTAKEQLERLGRSIAEAG